MAARAGRIHVVRGDIRRLSCDAWLVPTDGAGRVEPSWVAWPPGAARDLPAPRPFPHWTHDATRVRPLDGWPAGLPAPWQVHVELDSAVPSSWFVEAAADFVRRAGRAAREAGPRRNGPGRSGAARTGPRGDGRPLLAVPVGVAGIGAAQGDHARRAAGSLVAELVPELSDAATEVDGRVALVAHSADAWVTAQAARRQAGAAPVLPTAARTALAPARAAAREGRLWLAVGPELARAAGLDDARTRAEALLDRLDLDGPRRATLRRLPPDARLAALSDHLGGPHALGQAVARTLHAHHHGLAHGLLAGLPLRRVIQWGEDDLVEQALSAAGRPADVLLDGPVRTGGPALLRLSGSLRAPGDLGRSLLDGGPTRSRLGALAALLQADADRGPHLLVLGHRADADLVRLLNVAMGRLPGPAACTVLGAAADGPDGTGLAGLWGERLTWLAPDPDGWAVDDDVSAWIAVLDWLGEGAATAGRLLDPGTRPLLPPADQALARAVQTFLGELPARARQGDGWQALARWLRDQGHPAD